LKKIGSAWINIGDSYSGSGGTGNQFGQIERGLEITRLAKAEIPSKSLCLTPFRFAIGMVENSSDDIYELDKRYIMCNNGCITEDKTDAIQGQEQRQGISQTVRRQVEGGESRPLQRKNDAMEGKEQREYQCLSSSMVQEKQGVRSAEGYKGECETAQSSKGGGIDSLWRKSAEVCLLWGKSDTIFNDRPHKWQSKTTQEGIGDREQILYNLRVVKSHELSTRFQSFVHELQLGIRKIWLLPPSRGRNICFRKKDIPSDLIPLFHIYKQERWCLRNTIIWAKANPMPESCKDRFTEDFEYLFFFSKNKKYYFEQQFEPHITEPGPLRDKRNEGYGSAFLSPLGVGLRTGYGKLGRNKRCVWNINTEPYLEAHFATYPEKLCEIPILAGCPSMICTKCGKAREKIIQIETNAAKTKPSSNSLDDYGKIYGSSHESRIIDKGYTDCGCNAGFEPGTVLDIFAGSGTTLAVAKRLGRKFMGIELNPDYCKLAQKRISEVPLPMELGL
jgi:hypothetical protein